MHRPDGAVHTFFEQVGRRGLDQVVVKKDKVERRPDPRHRGDDMQPAQQQVGPIEQIGFHEGTPVYSPLRAL
jgi:hypothetical protein